MHCNAQDNIQKVKKQTTGMLPKELQIDSHCARVIIVDESRECCSLGLKLDRLGHLGSQLAQVVRLKGGISQPDFFAIAKNYPTGISIRTFTKPIPINSFAIAKNYSL